MDTILNHRVTFITAIFSSFGSVLILLFNIENVSYSIGSIAMLLSLIASFLVSILLKEKTTRRTKSITAVLMFVTTCCLFYMLQSRRNLLTVAVEEFNGNEVEVNRYFKGQTFTENAKKLIELYPTLKYDNTELLSKFEFNPKRVWTDDSIGETELHLSIWYFLFVIGIVSTITLMVELLKTKKKTMRKPTQSLVEKSATTLNDNNQLN